MTNLEQRTIIIPGVEKLSLHNKSNDLKGPVYEWTDFTSGVTRQINAFSRKAGTLFGDHFHTGRDPAKNPELFFVVYGSFDFWAYDKFNDKRGTAILTAGDTITIHPHILHGFKAITDVVYVEARITKYGEIKDQFSADEYTRYQKPL